MRVALLATLGVWIVGCDGREAAPGRGDSAIAADATAEPLADAAVDNTCDFAPPSAAHERAVATANLGTCAADADCVLTTRVPSCVGSCGVAVPNTKLAELQALQDRDVEPLCTMLRARGCGVPIVDCGPPVARCTNNHCVVTTAVCPAGAALLSPGCGTPKPTWEKGCYASCSAVGDNASCAPGYTCQETSVDPCVPKPGENGSCAACGMQTHLCLPALAAK